MCYYFYASIIARLAKLGWASFEINKDILIIVFIKRKKPPKLFINECDKSYEI